MSQKDKDQRTLAEAEIDARREAGLKKLLATPPKHHEPLKGKKAKPAPRKQGKA